jgi:TM2 domain-containing membrane protein YozV
MSSYSDYPGTPPAGDPASPPGPAGPGDAAAGYGAGQAQARPQEQYGSQPQYGTQAPYGTQAQHGTPGQYGTQAQYGAPGQYAVQPYAQQPGYPGGMGQPQGQLVVAPRNPVLYLIASFFIPGLGSMLNSRVGIGIGILCLYVVGLILTFVLIGIPIALGAWIWGLVDGYQSTVNWNRAHGIIS